MANPQTQLLSDQGKVQLSLSRLGVRATRLPRVDGVPKSSPPGAASAVYEVAASRSVRSFLFRLSSGV